VCQRRTSFGRGPLNNKALVLSLFPSLVSSYGKIKTKLNSKNSNWPLFHIPIIIHKPSTVLKTKIETPYHHDMYKMVMNTKISTYLSASKQIKEIMQILELASHLKCVISVKNFSSSSPAKIHCIRNNFSTQSARKTACLV